MEKITSQLEFTTDVIGFGTYKIPPGSETYKAVSTALEVGYRSIDTAKFYNNEQDVGLAVRESGLEKEVQITTKVWNDEHGKENALIAGRRSRDLLGIDSIDLLLIHWPGKDKYIQTWEAFEQLKEEGTVKNIGVSNFNPNHLHDLRKAGLSTPVVNQIEYNPLFSQKHVKDYCDLNSIIIEAWRPIVSGDIDLLSDLEQIGLKYNKSVTQIALRWAIQTGCRVLPKSVHRERMIENISIFDFELNDEDMEKINSFNKNYRTGPDPAEFF